MKGNLIYISPGRSSFTDRDIEFLSREYNVITFDQKWNNKKTLILTLLQQFFFLLRKLPKSEAIIVMFGGYWSFLPSLIGKLFREPVYIILGGADCVSFPEYNYGSLRKPFLRTVIYLSYKWAKKLLPVDESLIISDYNYDLNVKLRHQGFKYFFPGLSTPYQVIYNGFDATYWQTDSKILKNNSFTTIAKVGDNSRYVIKGIDLFITTASRFPQYQFNIIGISDDFVKSLGNLPLNIKCFEFLSKSDVKAMLAESRFYLQLSVSEGFPNALSEAMLCECIPICSNVGGMAFILNDCGTIIDKKDPEIIVQNIERLTSLSDKELDGMGKQARLNISSRFPIKKREKAFMELLKMQTFNQSY